MTLVRTTTVTHTVTTTQTAPAACSGNLLSGTFTQIPGSSGAGQIEYALKLTNTSQRSCTLDGVGLVQLLDANGAFLPTHAGSGLSGAGVTLAPGASAVANARFSPDVSGQGDSQGGPCQPIAHTLRFSPVGGGGSVDAAIKPPTSVCEQGRLSFQPFAAS